MRSCKIIERSSAFLLFTSLLCLSATAMAHGVAEGDKAFIQANPGINIIPYIYLGAKHMVTGYDHLLFLFGVIFFLYKLKDIWTYVTLFAVGHSTTLLLGVIFNVQASSYLVDAIIGLSVVYKALDNLGAFPTLIGFQPNQKAAVLIFGFFHGFGLATKLQDLIVSREGLFANLVSFNVGVEIGQLMALSVILIAMTYWRKTKNFAHNVVVANGLLMMAGIVLTGYQLAGFFSEKNVMTITNADVPYQASPKTLLRASLAALAGGAAILVLFVLPAEYAIDPTGVGKALGLTRMAGEAEEVGADTPPPTAAAATDLVIPEQTQLNIEQKAPLRSDEKTITIAPHEGVEVKARMEKGEHLIFRWTATGPVKMDMHGEPKVGREDEFSTYWKQKDLSEAQGSFTATFAGQHGWYWRNQGETPVTLTLKTNGFYKELFEPPAE